MHGAAVGGPEFGEVRQTGIRRGLVAGEGDVVDERVEPDVGDEILVEGKLDAPLEAFLGAGDAEVDAGIAFQRVEQLGLAEGGDDDFGVVFDEVLEPIGVVAEFEVPVFLFDFDDFPPLGTEVASLVAVAFLQELFLADRVVAGMGFFVELALALELGEDGADAGLVALVDGFGPAVVLDVEFLPQIGEFQGRALDEGFGRDAFLLRRLLDFLAVLVDAGEEKHLVAAQTTVAGDHVGKHLFIGVADVRGAVGVVDRGG